MHGNSAMYNKMYYMKVKSCLSDCHADILAMSALILPFCQNESCILWYH